MGVQKVRTTGCEPLSVCLCVCMDDVGCIPGHGCLTSRPSVSGLAQNRFFKAMPELSCGPERETERHSKTVKILFCWSLSVRYSHCVPSVGRLYLIGRIYSTNNFCVMCNHSASDEGLLGDSREDQVRLGTK